MRSGAPASSSKWDPNAEVEVTLNVAARAPQELVAALTEWQLCENWPPVQCGPAAVTAWNVALKPLGSQTLTMSGDALNCLPRCVHAGIHFAEATHEESNKAREMLMDWVQWYHDRFKFDDVMVSNILQDSLDTGEVRDVSTVPQDDILQHAKESVATGYIPPWVLFVVAAKLQARVWMLRLHERHHAYPHPYT